MTLGVDNAHEISSELGEIRDKPLDIKAFDYKDWLKTVDSFFSLDISVHGTGWISWNQGTLSWGRISLKASTEVERVAEFRKALLDIIKDTAYDYYFIEDVIGSCNFKTAKALYALNSVVDTLIYDKTIAAPIALMRESNTVWKKNLRGIAGSEIVIKARDYTNGSDKECTKACLEALGISIDNLKRGQYTDKQVEDICDALGMALGTIAVKINKAPVVKTKTQSVDIRHGYDIKQFLDLESAYQSALRLSKRDNSNILIHDLTADTATNLIKYMANLIPDDPKAVYIINTPVSKCCNLLLVKKLATEADSYFLVIRKH